MTLDAVKSKLSLMQPGRDVTENVKLQKFSGDTVSFHAKLRNLAFTEV
jgi:hypothetical protein